jgi:hypothetical protein
MRLPTASAVQGVAATRDQPGKPMRSRPPISRHSLRALLQLESSARLPLRILLQSSRG